MASSTNNSHPECPSDSASSSSIKKEPKKSILKNPLEHHDDHHKHKGASFDEMNILATYHPAGKDYGHMKIDEPKTPYRNEEGDDLDPEDISERLAKVNEYPRERPRYDSGSGKSDNDFDDDDDEHLSPEEKEKARKFREHRKEHYNMKKQIQLAKELLAKEMAELED